MIPGRGTKKRLTSSSESDIVVLWLNIGHKESTEKLNASFSFVEMMDYYSGPELQVGIPMPSSDTVNGLKKSELCPALV